MSITRIALVFLIAAAAFAQTSHLQCYAAVAVPPLTLRSEGLTELVGDFFFNCTGGTPTAVGVPVPQAVATLSLNGPITSRQYGASSQGSQSDALLLIDEPAPQNQKVLEAGVTIPGTGTGVDYSTAGNVVQGVQTASNSINFSFPFDPGSHTLRFTNIRFDATSLPLPAGGTGFVIGSVNIPGVAYQTVTLGKVQSSLNTALTSPPVTVPGCTGAPGTPLQNSTVLRYQQLFENAFKIDATRNASGSLVYQNTPGFSYNTESGFYNLPLFPDYSIPPGLADFGTRFKAVFNNVPDGVDLYVSTNNLNNSSGLKASLTASENPPFSAVAPTGSALLSGTSYGVTQLTPANGSAEAVWEVITAPPASNSPADFGVWFSVNAGTPATLQSTMLAITSYLNFRQSAPNDTYIPRWLSAGTPFPILATGDCTVTSPSLAASESTLNVNGAAGSVVPIQQSITVTSNGTSIPFTVSSTTSSSGNWLSVTPTSTTTPGGLNISVNPAGLPAGPYSGSITVNSTSGNVTIPVQLTLSGATPSFPADGVVNAATQLAGPVSPGEIITIYGTGVGPANNNGGLTVVNNQVWPEVDGTQVLFDGVPAPIIYVSPGQTSAVVPYAVAGHATTPVQVEVNGILGAPVGLVVADSVPGIFTANSSGKGQGAILNQDFTLNSASNPAAAGSVIILYATGEGQTDPAGQDGVFSTAPYPKPLGNVSVTIGGQQAFLNYAGEAPYEVAGVLQVNAVIPPGTPGGAIPVVLTVGNNSSPAGVTVQVK